MTDPTSPSPRYPELTGGVAVVTGAAKGIGEGIARRLAAEGMRVAAVDIDVETLASTVSSLREGGADATAICADLSRVEDIDDLFDRVADEFGGVDLLVNNAADLRRSRVLVEHAELLDLQLATNVRGPYLCSQRAAALMRTSGGGSIVNITSVGALRAHHRGLPYDVTKGAINAMTLAMAVDLGEHGIRVNAVGPGVTRTHLSERHGDPVSDRETAERIPLGRAGTVDDVAAVVAFLASAEAAYVTGQIIYVDGGITAQLSPRGKDGLERTDREGWPDEQERTETP